MILSRGRRYIFVHIPKTGGTSLALALEGRAMKDDIMLGDTPKALKRRRRVKDVRANGRLWKHSGLSDIEGLASRSEIEGFYTFTLVRNPWDRMVSYYHWLQQQDFEHPAVDLSKALSFQDFLGHAQIEASLKSATYQSYMTDMRGVERCNLYVRLEHFETDAAPLFEHLGFRLKLPHENPSNRDRDYRRYYTEKDAARLGDICQVDIDRFGYRFD